MGTFSTSLSLAQQQAICKATNCSGVISTSLMQPLWASQGELIRLQLLKNPKVNSNANTKETLSVVVKYIHLTEQGHHPHGWSGEKSYLRKKKSYEVEHHWYQHFANTTANQNLNASAPSMATLLYSQVDENTMLLVLEDISTQYPVTFTQGKDDQPSKPQIHACLTWLANFHAKYLNETDSQKTSSLWPIGGYWHLATRPDEWQGMAASSLKDNAYALDNLLTHCRYQTIIHGDAKLANFCFSQAQSDAQNQTQSEAQPQVCAVDFQYVGQGPGIKDVMLLMSSVLSDKRLLTEGTLFINYYFEQLAQALKTYHVASDHQAIITAWRELYCIAWADFHRFLAGWKPNHWKIGQYCQQQTDKALAML